MAQVLVGKACSVHQNRQGSWKGRLVFHSIIAGWSSTPGIGHEEHVCWYFVSLLLGMIFPCRNKRTRDFLLRWDGVLVFFVWKMWEIWLTLLNRVVRTIRFLKTFLENLTRWFSRRDLFLSQTLGWSCERVMWIHHSPSQKGPGALRIVREFFLPSNHWGDVLERYAVWPLVKTWWLWKQVEFPK